jgi:hypothetical protein
MSWMFHESVFNGDISNWDTGSVWSMAGMFASSPFDQDIGGWKVDNVTNMRKMFQGASSFDKDISGWCVKSVTYYPEFGSGLQQSYLPPFGSTTNCN